MIAAARTTGEARASAPDLNMPDDCDDHMQRVIPKLGEKVRWSQRRWEFAADNIDRQIDRCAAFVRDHNRKWK